jgi:PST family polysaccharide transporter
MTPENNRGIARLAVRNTVWVTLGSYVGQLISFGATLVLVRLLGPEVFGLFAMGMFWASLLALDTKLGLNYAAIQRPTLDGELIGTLYGLGFGLAAGSLVLAAGATVLLLKIGYAKEVTTTLMVLMSVSSISVLTGPLGVALEKELQLSRVTLVSIIASAVAYALAIGLAFVGAGIWSLLTINIGMTLVSMGGTYWVCRRRLPQIFRTRWRFSPQVARQLLSQGVPIGLSGFVTSSIVNQFDNFLIGTFVGVTVLGFYDRAYRISQWPNVLLTAAVVRVALLTFAKVKSDPPRLTRAVQLTLWILTVVGLPVALMLSFGAPDVVRILYGSAWAPSAFFLRFLAVFSLLSPFVALTGSLSIALGHKRMVILLASSQAAVLVVLGTPLTLWLGAPGTVLAVGTMIVVGFGLSCRYVFRQVSLSIASSFGPALLAAGAAGLLTLAATNLPAWAAMPALLRLIVVAATAPGSYLGLMFVLRRSEMMENVRYLHRTFKPKGVNGSMP